MIVKSKCILQGLIVLLLLLNAEFLVGQHDHSSHGGHDTYIPQAPHGGQLKENGKYSIEMLINLFLKEDKLSFYLYKGNLKPISTEGITGTVAIKYEDGKIVTDTLVARGDQQFVAQLESTISFQCIVSFEIKSKTYSVEFSHMGLEHSTSVIYSCPIHTEIRKEKPGTCPICGMNLNK